MSKSEESDYSRINLSDSPDLISKKIKRLKPTLEIFQIISKSWKKGQKLLIY